MARQARHLDSRITAADKKKLTVEVLNFTAAVFHKSRCGQHADRQSAGGRRSGRRVPRLLGITTARSVREIAQSSGVYHALSGHAISLCLPRTDPSHDVAPKAGHAQ
jgi:hypothetical protein